MKIADLVSGVSVMFTNEEMSFLKKHQRVKISSLDEHQQWLAQNLVRKGAYSISTDDNILIRKLNETNS